MGKLMFLVGIYLILSSASTPEIVKGLVVAFIAYKLIFDRGSVKKRRNKSNSTYKHY